MDLSLHLKVRYRIDYLSKFFWKLASEDSSMGSPISGGLKEYMAQTMGSKLSNCYVFKSRLQEYAQKVGFPTPVYETSKEGPSHEPSFQSTVIVNDVRYDSLTGFSNRKAAEQSAAEIALMELSKSGEMKESISQPVHETGLCKNLLQEYAQKMNYAIPTYECQSGASSFTCTVEIGGICYVGASAKNKKEAEIKAARTALLALELSYSWEIQKPEEQIQYTVIPCKRKSPETPAPMDGPRKTPKRKKPRFLKKRDSGIENGSEVADTAILNKDSGNGVALEQSEICASDANHQNIALAGNP